MKDIRDAKIGDVVRYDYVDRNNNKVSTYIFIDNISDVICAGRKVYRGKTATCDYSTGENFVFKDNDEISIDICNEHEQTVLVHVDEPYHRYMINEEIKAVNFFYHREIESFLNSSGKWFLFDTDYGKVLVFVDKVIDRGTELVFKCKIKCTRPHNNNEKDKFEMVKDDLFFLSKINFKYLNYKELNNQDSKNFILENMNSLILESGAHVKGEKF